MTAPRIHLIAAGSPIGVERLKRLGLRDVAGLCRRVEQVLDGEFEVRADARCLLAREDDQHGGRADDHRRRHDIERALSDDRVTAIVALCGGAWFLRVAGQIDWSLVARRSEPLCVVGSSEMTSLLVQIAGRRRCRAILDTMPLFALRAFDKDRKMNLAFDEHWIDLARVIRGRCSTRQVVGRVLNGHLPKEGLLRVIGGNLTLLASMLGGPLAKRLVVEEHWLALEDVNEKPERIDRMLAQLRHAGLLDRAAGLLLGDFRREEEDLARAVEELLPFHLKRRIPVISRCDFGHIWPGAPLPLREPLRFVRRGEEIVIRPTNTTHGCEDGCDDA